MMKVDHTAFESALCFGRPVVVTYLSGWPVNREGVCVLVVERGQAAVAEHTNFVALHEQSPLAVVTDKSGPKETPVPTHDGPHWTRWVLP